MTPDTLALNQQASILVTGKGSAAASASSISRSVATATAAVFTRALAAVKIVRQIQNSVQTAISSAVATVRPIFAHRRGADYSLSKHPQDLCLCVSIRQPNLHACKAACNSDAAICPNCKVRGGGNATAAAAAAARAIGTAVTTALSMAQSQVVVQGELSKPSPMWFDCSLHQTHQQCALWREAVRGSCENAVCYTD